MVEKLDSFRLNPEENGEARMRELLLYQAGDLRALFNLAISVPFSMAYSQ